MEIQCTSGTAVDVPEFGVAIKPSLEGDSSIVINIDALDNQPAVAAQVRHDIRNHLNSITIGLRLLKDEYESGEFEEAHETFDSIQDHLRILNTYPALVRTD